MPLLVLPTGREDDVVIQKLAKYDHEKVESSRRMGMRKVLTKRVGHEPRVGEAMSQCELAAFRMGKLRDSRHAIVGESQVVTQGGDMREGSRASV